MSEVNDVISEVRLACARVHRDMVEFQQKIDQFNKQEFDCYEEKLTVSSSLVSNASFLLMFTTNVRHRIQYEFSDAGLHSFQGTRRDLLSTMSDYIQSIRTILSAHVEINRSVRDILAYKVSRDKIKDNNARNLQ